MTTEPLIARVCLPTIILPTIILLAILCPSRSTADDTTQDHMSTPSESQNTVKASNNTPSSVCIYFALKRLATAEATRDNHRIADELLILGENYKREGEYDKTEDDLSR